MKRGRMESNHHTMCLERHIQRQRFLQNRLAPLHKQTPFDPDDLYETYEDEKLHPFELKLERVVYDDLFSALLRRTGLVQKEVDSYNMFLNNFEEIILSHGAFVWFQPKVRKMHVVTIRDVELSKPSIKETDGKTVFVTDEECQERGLTYASSAWCTCLYEIFDLDPKYEKESEEALKNIAGAEVMSRIHGNPFTAFPIDTQSKAWTKCLTNVHWKLIESHIHLKKHIGRIPIMVGSRACNSFHDPADGITSATKDPGHFIVEGNKKIITTSKIRRINTTFVFKGSDRDKSEYECTLRARSVRIRTTNNASILVKNITTSKETIPNAFDLQGSGVREAVMTLSGVYIGIPLMAIARIFKFTSKASVFECLWSGAILGVQDSNKKAKEWLNPNSPELTGDIFIDEERSKIWDFLAPLLGPIGTSTLHTKHEPVDEEYEQIHPDLNHVKGIDVSDAKLLSKNDAHAKYGPDHIPDFENIPGGGAGAAAWVDAKSWSKAQQYDRKRSINMLLNSRFAPHVSNGNGRRDMERKAKYFVYMLWRIVQAHFNKEALDDRDHPGNVMVELSGNRMSSKVAQLWRDFMESLKTNVRSRIEGGKTPDPVGDSWTEGAFTKGLHKALSVNKWAPARRPTSSANASGVSQSHIPNNRMGGLSEKRKIKSRADQKSKNVKQRYSRVETGFDICVLETPEGAPAGLVRNLGSTAKVSMGCGVNDMERVVVDHVVRIKELGVMDDDYVSINCDTIDTTYKNAFRVHVNGRPVAVVQQKHVKYVTELLRELRRMKKLPEDCEVICYEHRRDIEINCENGIIVFPLIVLRHGRKTLWAIRRLWYECLQRGLGPQGLDYVIDGLMAEGLLEYVSKMEESTNCVVLPSDHVLQHLKECGLSDLHQFTHAQFCPEALLGLSACMNPFPNFNQGPRNTFTVAHSKNTLSNGDIALFNNTNSAAILNPQIPIVRTSMDEQSLLPMKTGINFVVAIMTGGYNIEDAIIMNKGTIDRGAGRAMVTHCSTKAVDTQGSDVLKFKKPGPECVGVRDANYDFLDEDGAVPPGTFLPGVETFDKKCEVPKRNVLIGTTAKTTETGQLVRSDTREHDHSCLQQAHESDSVVLSSKHAAAQDGHEFKSTHTRSQRIPEVGDKFTSSHGQKGVIGHIVPEEDMPYANVMSKKGKMRVYRPDIIINPHSMPSRMTLGHLQEMLMGLASCVSGKYGDGSAFLNRDLWGAVEEEEERMTVDDICDILKKHGMDEMGLFPMNDGTTGLPMQVFNGSTGEYEECKAYMGVIFYMKLKQIVSDKIQVRGDGGPIVAKTRQPTSGRKNTGGGQFGEMERDSIMAHGAPNVLYDRTFMQSNPYGTWVCKDCGLLAQNPQSRDMDGDMHSHSIRNSRAYCGNCDSYDTPVFVRMPYATKLVNQELMGMHIAMRSKVEGVSLNTEYTAGSYDRSLIEESERPLIYEEMGLTPDGYEEGAYNEFGDLEDGVERDEEGSGFGDWTSVHEARDTDTSAMSFFGSAEETKMDRVRGDGGYKNSHSMKKMGTIVEGTFEDGFQDEVDKDKKFRNPMDEFGFK